MAGGPPNVTPLVVPRGRKVGRLTVYSDADASAAPKRDYFLKGIISPNEMSTIYGEPGCGKSFLALYIARAIAQEREVFGRRVHATNILFLALEGVSGFEKRLKAMIDTAETTENFFYVAQPVNLFSDDPQVAEVVQASQSCDAGMIVIDTLNRAMAGGSENDPADMGKLIQSLDRIRLATGAHICIIHHSGKDSSRGMRGHSSLLGAADMVMEVRKGQPGEPRTIFIEKAKDDADGQTFHFALDIHKMGLDDDGDPISTCIVREIDTSETTGGKTEKLTPVERRWMDQIHELFAGDDRVTLTKPMRKMAEKRCVTRDGLRVWMKVRGVIGVTESVTESKGIKGADRTTMSRVLNSLALKKKIAIHGDWIWLVS